MDLPLQPPLFQCGICQVVHTHTQVLHLAYPTLSCQVPTQVPLTPILPILGEALALTQVLPLWADLGAFRNKALSGTHSVPYPQEGIRVTIRPVMQIQHILTVIR